MCVCVCAMCKHLANITIYVLAWVGCSLAAEWRRRYRLRRKQTKISRSMCVVHNMFEIANTRLHTHAERTRRAVEL